jgi:N-acetylneuraminic acid mutarotase
MLLLTVCSCAKPAPPVASISGTWDSLSAKGLLTHGGHTASFVGGKIYLIGGVSHETPNEDSTSFFCPVIQVFDLQKNEWSTLKTTGTFTPRISFGERDRR